MTVQERMERLRAILEEPVSMGRFIEPIRVGSLKNRGACGVCHGFFFWAEQSKLSRLSGSLLLKTSVL